MRFVEVRVRCPLGWQELIAETLAGGRDEAAAFESAAPEPGTPDGPAWLWVRTAFPEREGRARRPAIERRLRELGQRVPELRSLPIAFATLVAEDVATAWRRSLKPFRVGKLAVLPPWSEVATRPADRVLRIEPGMSFGSGRHSTTRACLRRLQEHLPAGGSVLDAGTGSGILAVAAGLFGARRVLGFDVDEHAREAASELAERHGLGGRCEFRTGGFEVLEADDGAFDLVLANLYADLLVRHADDLVGRLRPGGTLVASGIAAERAGAVSAAFRARALPAGPLERRGRWCSALFVAAAEGARPGAGA